MQIVFEAIPYGYGPASEIVAVAGELQSQIGKDCRMIAIGDKTSYRIFTSTSIFDECMRFQYDTSGVTPSIAEVLQTSDAVVSCHSPLFLDAVQEYDVSCFIVNPLDWIDLLFEKRETWGSLPDWCDAYYIPKIPGIYSSTVPMVDQIRNKDGFVIVNPIRNNHVLRNVRDINIEEEEEFILVNFGGMDSLLGENEELAFAMASDIAAVAESSSKEWRLLFSGGGHTMGRIERELQAADTDIKVITETRSHKAFLRDLARCDILLSVPGLNLSYEAIFFEKETMFLLPMKYSQELQLQLYPEFLQGYEKVNKRNIEPFEQLSANISESEGEELCRAQGREFSEDQEARESFQSQISEYLHRDKRKPIQVLEDSDGVALISFDGATEIASSIGTFLR